MKPEEIRAMLDAEIESAIGNARRELFNLRFQHASGRLSDTSRMRLVRRDLARLLTARRERALWAQFESETGKGA
jgi:large subunit ribosomal protein L29